MSEYTDCYMPRQHTNTERSIKILQRDMETTHEEADVIIPQQIHIAKESGKVQNFKVICDDANVFVLLL